MLAFQGFFICRGRGWCIPPQIVMASIWVDIQTGCTQTGQQALGEIFAKGRPLSALET